MDCLRDMSWTLNFVKDNKENIMDDTKKHTFKAKQMKIDKNNYR